MPYRESGRRARGVRVLQVLRQTGSATASHAEESLPRICGDEAPTACSEDVAEANAREKAQRQESNNNEEVCEREPLFRGAPAREYDVRVLEDDSIEAAQNKEQRATGLRIRGRRRKTTAHTREVNKEQT